MCKGPGWGRGGVGKWGRGWREKGTPHLWQVSWRSAPENEGNQQSGFASFQAFESLPISPCSSKALPVRPGSTPPPLPAQDLPFRFPGRLCFSGLLVSNYSTSHVALDRLSTWWTKTISWSFASLHSPKWCSGNVKWINNRINNNRENVTNIIEASMYIGLPMILCCLVLFSYFSQSKCLTQITIDSYRFTGICEII